MPPCPDRRAARWRRASHHRRPHRLSLGCVRRVSWFCSLKGNEFFAEVEEDFIQDDFNLTGLSAQVPHYEFALDTILDVESPATAGFSEEQQESIESAAELLYGLIHARFIITPRGMSAMLDKYKNTHFGRCPRAFCQGQPVLPVGQARLLPAPQQPTCPSPLSPDARARNKNRLIPPRWPSRVAQSDVPRMHTSKVFCPKCSDIYYPRSQRQANVDGAYFGTTFSHLFLQTYWDLVPPAPTMTYTPRIFGFKIHRTAKQRAGEKPGQPTAASSSASALVVPGVPVKADAPASSSRTAGV